MVKRSDRGSALLTTSVLMFAITLLAIAAFSYFYYGNLRVNRTFNRVKERIAIETIAQDIFIEINDEVLPEASFVINFDSINYDVLFEDDKYRYEVSSLDKKMVLVVVFLNDHTILSWSFVEG